MEKLIAGIETRDKEVLYGEDYSKIRSVFAFFNRIGYFWVSRRYGSVKDILALFPQVIEIWDIGVPIVENIRRLPHQEQSFIYY